MEWEVKDEVNNRRHEGYGVFRPVTKPPIFPPLPFTVQPFITPPVPVSPLVSHTLPLPTLSLPPALCYLRLSVHSPYGPLP